MELKFESIEELEKFIVEQLGYCLLYTSDAADD